LLCPVVIGTIKNHYEVSDTYDLKHYGVRNPKFLGPLEIRNGNVYHNNGKDD
jgi:hypothetical protein